MRRVEAYIKNLLIVLFVLSTFLPFSFLSASDFRSSSRGTTTSSFLKLGVGARAMAMAEAYSALVEDATSLYWNPAALSQLDQRSATFMHASYLESSFFDYGAYAHPFKEGKTLGFGVQYFSAGRITQRDNNGFSQGGFDPNDLALSLGYAKKMETFSLGAAVKYIRSEIVSADETAALDVGLLSPLYFDRLRLAATFSNMGGKIKFDQADEDLPFLMVLGGSYKVSGRLVSSFDLKIPRDNKPYAAFGTEYVIPTKGSWNWAGRLGYNSRTLNDVDGVTGLTAGIGLAGPVFSLDYGFVPYGRVGLSHLFSVSTTFGK